MLNLLMLVILAACTIQKPRNIGVIYNQKLHPTWQAALLDQNCIKYNMLFLNSAYQPNINSWLKTNHIDYIISDLTLKTNIRIINPNKIRQQILYNTLPSNYNIVNEHKKTALKQLCKSQRNLLIDLPEQATTKYLEQMPRICRIKHIWVTNKPKKFSPYLAPILDKVIPVTINDNRIMQQILKNIKCI